MQYIEADELYKMAIDNWGMNYQLTIAIEECSELIKSISKYKRTENAEKVIEEIADVEIILGQLKEMFDDDKIYHEKMQKLNRLQYLLEEGD